MAENFIQNASLLITLSVFYGIIKWYRPKSKIYFQLVSGVWFGLVAVAAMMMPFEYNSGIFYDGRSVIITLAGFWGGGVTALVSVIIAGVYRAYSGGTGIWAGLATIIFCGITGLVFRQLLQNRLNTIKFPVFLGIGLVAHIIMLASQLLIPHPFDILKKIWLPVFIVFPFAFALISKLFQFINSYISNIQKIKEAEELYRTTLLSIGDAVICTDKNGYINQMNKVAEELTGWKFQEAKGKCLEEIIPIINEKTRIKVENPYNKVIRKGKIVGLANHTLLITKDGREIPIADSGAPIKNKDEIIGVVMVFRDQTAEREKHKILVEAKSKAEESEQLKTAFLANMSHEIRTPLNGILGFTTLLTEDRDLSTENKKEFATIINKSAEGLLKIINDILDISRLETGKTVIEHIPFDGVQMLLTIHSIFQKILADSGKSNIELKMEAPSGPVILTTDETRLIQIFSNLLDNALRFTPKGIVTFGITKISDTKVECFVSDTGIGIQAEKQRLIFERFSQADNTTSRSYGGTGLGLTIVRKLVELMGSQIFLQSEPGKGSRFWFSLPYSPAAAKEHKTQQNKANITSKNNAAKILVVEDDPASKIYFERILDHSFEKIIFATSGKQALELYEKESPDIILLDIGLPDINGFDLTRKIRQKDKNVIIIAQTAYAMANDEQKAIEAGCNDYIAKPIKKELLLKKLTKRR